MPTSTFAFRIGINLQSGDRLFTDANVQSGVVIPKTAQDNAICPPMPNTIPSPWNAFLTGTTSTNDYRLHQRWEPLNAPALPAHNTTTNRWEYGKHNTPNAEHQGIQTTYKVNILSFGSRFEIHDSPWDGIASYLPHGCFRVFDSLYSFDEIEPALDMQRSEYACFFCGFFANDLPICVFWIYHATADYNLQVTPQERETSDFYPASQENENETENADNESTCTEPAYYLYRAMGFKFGNRVFRAPVFVQNGRFEIEHNRLTNEWTGNIYDASNQRVYTVTYSFATDPQMQWGAWFCRIGQFVGRQFNGAGLEWTRERKYTPWISQWDILSTPAASWEFIDEIVGLNPTKLYRLSIDNEEWSMGFFYQIRTEGTWSAPMPMILENGVWRTGLHTNVDAIRYYAQLHPRPVEMVTGWLEEITQDQPTEGNNFGNNLVVDIDIRMPLVSRCRNIARFVLTRVSGEGTCRLILIAPSGKEIGQTFSHLQLPITIELPIIEAGDWIVRVYDGDGSRLRFERMYRVRRGDAQPRTIEYKRRAVALTACYPIEGVPDTTSQLEDEMFVVESGIDDASWR